MQTPVANLSVLSVPIEACDRRALSEAWFSALRLHRSALVQGAVGCREFARAATVSAPRFRLSADLAQSMPRQGTRPMRSARSVFCGEPAPGQGAALRSLLAAKIARTFFEPQRPPRQASFVVETGKSRVHIVVRGARSGVHVVALCSRAARSAVAAALADVRTALHARGLRPRMQVGEAGR